MSSRIKTFIGVLFVILCTIALHYGGILSFVEKPLRRLIGSGTKQMYQWTVTIGDEDLVFDSVEDVLSMYQKTRDELAAEKNRAVRYALLEEENETLRQQLHFFKEHPAEHVGADVIGRNIEPVGNTLVIDQGGYAGIANGQPVLSGNGILIGKIVRTEHDTAIVQLVNDGQSKVAATVMNRDRSIGIVEGGYGISIRMNFIPQNELVSPGDVIITSGLEPQIPRGLIIGTVEAVEKEAYQPFQRAVLTPQEKLEKVITVSVIIGVTTTQRL